MNTSNNILEDIRYLRDLAEKGRQGPILGGSFLAAAGIVFGIVCFVHWAAITGRLAISNRGMEWIWGAGYVVSAIVWFALWFALRSRRRAVSASASNAVFGVAWLANAAGVLTAWATTSVAASIMHLPELFYAFIPTIFIFYGLSWGLSAIMALRRWMYVPAAGSFAFAFVMAKFTYSPAQMAVMGAGLLLLLTLPGFKLVRDETGS